MIMKIFKLFRNFFSCKKEQNIDTVDELVEPKSQEESPLQGEDIEKVSTLPEATDVNEETTSGEEPVQQSLLDNSSYMSLAEQCRMMHEELDRMQMQVADASILDFIMMQKSRIREALVLSGARIIDEETEFNRLRHQSVPASIVNNGTPVSETVEAGVEIDNRVIIRAKVKI